MNELVGKTIASVVYQDAWNNGITLTFTDGTQLQVKELMQAGQIGVLLDGEELQSDWHKELENE
jgi:hypothetical protein